MCASFNGEGLKLSLVDLGVLSASFDDLVIARILVWIRLSRLICFEHISPNDFSIEGDLDMSQAFDSYVSSTFSPIT